MMRLLKQKKFIALIIITLLISGCQSNSEVNEHSQPKLEQRVANDPIEKSLPFKLQFATPKKASELLSIRDDYLANLTLFDLESKTRNLKPSVENYVKLASQSVSTWTESEIEDITTDLIEINHRLEALDIKLVYPKEIHMIKSSVDEESNAHGYTRKNFIVLNENYISKNLIIHELWHVISRYNPDKANEIYKSLGFVENEAIEFPIALKEQIITNPDATNLNYTIKVTHNDIEKDAVLLIYSDRPYTGGKFFEYLKLGLFFPNHTNEPFTFDQIASLNEVEGFFEKVGTNTDYLLHVEEITAEHFRLLIIDEYKYLEDSDKIELLKNILQK